MEALSPCAQPDAVDATLGEALGPELAFCTQGGDLNV